MKSKYLIVVDFGLELPIVFSPLLGHEPVAGAQIVVSAGFCRRNSDGKFEVWGGSVKMKLKHRAEDADVLNRTLEYAV